jgi:hypothetical protein
MMVIQRRVAMMKRRRRMFDLRGLISESHCCVDCGYNTNPGCPTRAEAEQIFAAGHNVPQRYNERSEVYIVHNHVWQRAGMASGCLCIGCLEKRIGRRLVPDDFLPDHPFNELPGSDRLLERRGHFRDVLGEFPEDLVAA